MLVEMDVGEGGLEAGGKKVRKKVGKELGKKVSNEVGK